MVAQNEASVSLLWAVRPQSGSAIYQIERKEMSPPRRLPVRVPGLACCIVLNVVLAGLYLHMRSDLAETKTRLASMEAVVKQREQADPMQARECVELELGDSPDKPCLTTIRRLAMAPNKYHDRWVMVQGLYAGGFEMSALFPELPDRSIMAREHDRHSALWVSLNLPDTRKEMPLIVVSGKFKRGPSGHMLEYFGELVDAKVRSRERQG